MSNSPNLGLPYLAQNQSRKSVTVNDAFRRLDAAVQLTVENRDRRSPPGSPTEGVRYIVAANPTGAWAGHPFEVAAYLDGAWVFFTPKEGWLAYSRDESAIVYYNGSNWEIFTAAGATETAAKFGINTTADNSTRFRVRSDVSVFTPDNTQPVPTNDSRVIINKSANDATSSLIFQRNFSGRAEIGLLGSNDFELKTSASGNNFTTSFKVKGSNGRVDFTSVPRVNNSDVFFLSYPSRGDAEASSIPTSADQIEVRGYYNESDGGAARYCRVNALPDDGLGFEDADGGFWELFGDNVTVRQAGARGDGTTDDTNAVKRAFQSGRNVFIETGRYYITDMIRTGVIYQRVVGDGRGKAEFRVDTNFNMSRAGIFRIDHAYVTFEDFSIDFTQAGVSSRANLIKYPPAIYLVDRFRIRLHRLRFQEAYDGINALGNTGGAIFDDIECGCFRFGFRFGGALDSVEMRNCRVWPYEFAGNQTLLDIFSDGETVAFKIGQIDDLKMSNITPFRSKIIFEETINEFGEPEVPFGTITGLALDGHRSNIEMSAGEITISSLYATTNKADDTFIKVTGGVLILSDFSFEMNSLGNVPMVEVRNPSTICQMQNGRVSIGATPNGGGFKVFGGSMTVSSVRFRLTAGTTRTEPLIHQIGGQLVAYGNTATSPGSGVSGTFIDVSTNNDNVIFGNHSSGWAIELPNNQSNGVYALNHDGTGIV